MANTKREVTERQEVE